MSTRWSPARRPSYVEATGRPPLNDKDRARLEANLRLAESLGAVESLIEHPGLMTHASVAGSPLEVPDNLLRLSVGIESAADLVADLEQALS